MRTLYSHSVTWWYWHTPEGHAVPLNMIKSLLVIPGILWRRRRMSVGRTTTERGEPCVVCVEPPSHDNNPTEPNKRPKAKCRRTPSGHERVFTPCRRREQYDDLSASSRVQSPKMAVNRLRRNTRLPLLLWLERHPPVGSAPTTRQISLLLPSRDIKMFALYVVRHFDDVPQD